MTARSRIAALTAIGILSLALSGCAEKVDPLEVRQSLTITDVRDQTNSEYYTVRDTVTGVEDGIGARITLGFGVTHANQTKFSPVSTIHFPDGSTVVCEAGDPRRVPSLVDSLDTWDFECTPGAFPEDTDGAYLVVVDDYH